MIRNLGGHRPKERCDVLTSDAHQHLVDGTPVDNGSFPLLGDPWVRQPLDGDVLMIEHGGRTLRYDFRTWSRHDAAEQP